jgi:hypothetical protein
MFCLPPFTFRDRTTTIALDMLGRYGLTAKVFEVPGWSKAVMVEPTRMKAGQAQRAGRDLRARARMSAASTSKTVPKPERDANL